MYIVCIPLKCTGIGRATAIALAEAGWSVTLTARREAQLLETRSVCIQSRKDRTGTDIGEDSFLIAPGDITSEEFIRQLFAKTVEKFGRCHLTESRCCQQC